MIVKKFLPALVIVVVASLFILFPFTSTRTHGPLIKDKNGSSTNWSGYAVSGNNISDVKGSWVVPSLNCSPSQNTYSSAWVGIDGDGSSSVEQIGTEQDCINGTPRYYAWYEMYPKPSRQIPLNISAGQTMNGEVKYLGNGNFQLTLNGYNTIQKTNKANRVSAEWIMEAPWSGGVLPLANFGTANYSKSNTIVNNVSGTINKFTYDQINMVGTSGNKATTSGLDSTGSAFNITWNTSN